MTSEGNTARTGGNELVAPEGVRGHLLDGKGGEVRNQAKRGVEESVRITSDVCRQAHVAAWLKNVLLTIESFNV